MPLLISVNAIGSRCPPCLKLCGSGRLFLYQVQVQSTGYRTIVIPVPGWRSAPVGLCSPSTPQWEYCLSATRFEWFVFPGPFTRPVFRGAPLIPECHLLLSLNSSDRESGIDSRFEIIQRQDWGILFRDNDSEHTHRERDERFIEHVPRDMVQN